MKNRKMESDPNYIIGNIILEDLFYIALGVITRILVQIVDVGDESTINLKDFCKKKVRKWIIGLIISFPIVFFVAEVTLFTANHFQSEEFTWHVGLSAVTSFFTMEVVKILSYLKRNLPKYALDKIDSLLGKSSDDDRMRSDETKKS